jgi:hypothetical protein
MTTQTFERAQQRRLFTADVRARAGMRVDVTGEIRAENVIADQPRGARFFERDVHDVDQVLVLTARIDIAGLRIECIGSDQHALDEHVWIAFHQVSVFKGAWL